MTVRHPDFLLILSKNLLKEVYPEFYLFTNVIDLTT
jgi:hypothetical protein